MNRDLFSKYAALAFGVVTLAACPGTHSNGSLPLGENYKPPSISLQPANEKGVSLKLVSISEDIPIFELTNSDENPIYLFYDSSDNTKQTEVFRYWLQCGTEGKMKDLDKYVSHILPGLEPLAAGSAIRFKTGPVPNNETRKCKMSILYFDDRTVVEMVNDRPLDLSKDEYNFVEKSKKSVSVNFDLLSGR